jgi:hypothetical protein
VKPNRSIPSAVVVPAGHQWTFSQTLDDVAPEAWGGELVGPE